MLSDMLPGRDHMLSDMLPGRAHMLSDVLMMIRNAMMMLILFQVRLRSCT